MSGPLGPPVISFSFFFLVTIFFIAFSIFSSTMLASLRAQDRAYAPKEATKIMRGIEQIPEDSRELRRDLDRAIVV